MQLSMERKHNNRGSALVMVISLVAIVSMLVVLLLSLSLLNYRMKTVNLHSQNNFYDAEAVLDDIRTGLTEDVSDAVATAYEDTLSKYGSLSEAERNTLYMDTFLSGMESMALVDTTAAVDDSYKDDPADTTKEYYYYDLSYLWGKLDTATAVRSATSIGTYNSAKFSTSADLANPVGVGTGAAFTLPAYNTTQFHPIMVVDKKAGTITLRDLDVKYTDSQNYMSRITTDLVLSCPPIDYIEQSATPSDLLSYSFVADEKTSTPGGGTINVTGSAYLGSGVVSGGAVGAAVTSGSTLGIGGDFHAATVSFTGGTNGKLITGGTLLSEASSNVTINNMSVWAQELYVDSSALSVSGKTYLRDDLIMTNSMNLTNTPSASFSGTLLAYGNPENMDSTVAKEDQTLSLADRSSAFLINGKNAKLDLSGLTKLMIAGNSYVGTSSVDETNEDVLMGESVSLKSNQRAYLVPAKYIAPNCKHGGVNPLSNDAYNELLTEIQAVDGNDATANIKYFLDEENGQIPAELADMGVTDIRQEVYQIQVGSSTMNMVYFFLVFDSTADAVSYGRSYAASDSTLSARVDTSHYNTKVTYPGSMDTVNSNNNLTQNNNSSDNYSFYYNGSVLVADGSQARILTGQAVTLTSNRLNTRLKNEQQNYQKQFEALRHKLLDYYDELTSVELDRGVYDNLVLPMDQGNADFQIAQNVMKAFGDKDADGTISHHAQAIIVNGNCTLSGNVASNTVSVTDSTGNVLDNVSSDSLHLLIASGTVTINGGTSFDGLILAGSEVVLGAGGTITLKADFDAAADAMAAKDEAENYMAADYMVNGSMYLKNGTVGATGISAVRYQDYVTYSNWNKK